MHGLFRLIAIFCLFAALANGAVAHADELAGHREVTGVAQAQHFEGDADQVPADSDKDYPHHHGVCHGHELAAPLKALAAPFLLGGGAAPVPAPNLALISSPPARALRPPIS